MSLLYKSVLQNKYPAENNKFEFSDLITNMKIGIQEQMNAIIECHKENVSLQDHIIIVAAARKHLV